MTGREKFLKIAKFELKGELYFPSDWQWFWSEAINRWQKEGLPADVHTSQFFGFERMGSVPVNLGLMPPFDREVIEETADWRIVMDGSGVKKREFVDKGSSQTSGRSMPQWLEFSLKDRHTWQEFKKRLNPESPARYPQYWDDLKRCWKDRDYPLVIDVGSFYGWIRNWVGMENLAYMFYDEPNLVHEMMEYIEYFVIETIRKAVEEVDIDVGHFWEDMSFKTQSLISPKMFREFMLPHYKKVTEFLRSHGIEIITLDSDGNLNELIPLWLEGGVNGILPIEVAAMNNAVEWRKKYGKNLILIGNIDKRALAKDKKAIEEEVMKKVPYLLSQGGYFPTIDHAVPPDVPFENYQYYLSLLHKIEEG